MSCVICCFQGVGAGDDAPAAICPAPPRQSEVAAREQATVPGCPSSRPHAPTAQSLTKAHESMGSLTAWQLLAADVAAHPPSSGRGSTAAPSSARHRPAGSHRLGEDSDWPSGRGSTSHRLEAYDILGSIGCGAFGTAQQAVRRRDGCEVCIKQLNTGVMSWRQQEATRDEVRLLRRLAHFNVVHYHECFWKGPVQHIVMEYCQEGDLERLAASRRGRPFTQDEIMLLFTQLCLGIDHVHGKGIVHRDIKPSNILLSRGGVAKLGDFGLSRELSSGSISARAVAGTPQYMAPEAIQTGSAAGPADMWAAGCVLYELAAGTRPFSGSSLSAIAVRILRGAPAPLPDRYGADLRALVTALLSRDPTRRPCAGDVLRLACMQPYLQRYRAQVSGRSGGAEPSPRRGPPSSRRASLAQNRSLRLSGMGAPRSARVHPGQEPLPACTPRALHADLLTQIDGFLASGGLALPAAEDDEEQASRAARRQPMQDCSAELVPGTSRHARVPAESQHLAIFVLAGESQ